MKCSKCENCHHAGCERPLHAADPDGRAVQPLPQPALRRERSGHDGAARRHRRRVSHAHLAFQPRSSCRARSPRAARSGVRRPGGSAVVSREEQRRARDWAEQQALSAASDLFEKRVCVDCHEVTQGREPPRVACSGRWSRCSLTESWMPRASFDHASHKTSRCITCHVDADKSEAQQRRADADDRRVPHVPQRTGGHGQAAVGLPDVPQFHLPQRGLFDRGATFRARALPPTPAQRRVEESSRLGTVQ